MINRRLIPTALCEKINKAFQDCALKAKDCALNASVKQLKNLRIP